ncbi:MAG: sulfur carrier protein ThiS [Aquificaceae bacterium]|nr:sulfur carrier protein ThiS [Aquificaceae bacterium]MCS7277466.1 sulfur carrier protein ThiS [Aquificaceae bacterium]MDW8066253.1 sulfur carrier protein ThiS [Aquificaceae bacterium]MDW8422762.1 sulfur carrier protein ThiS [Aquificaceae bacterium]
MRVLINGKEVEVDDGISLKSLLQMMQIQIRPIGLAVAVNEEVVPKSKYEEFKLKEGDRIEIVNIVGGG